MSEWRDARLLRALQEAPDADLRPSPQTRRTVLEKARNAVAPARPAPWWQRVWQGTGSRQMPWNAAFATVVVATLVTVLWHDREVPDARTESATADRQAPALPASSASPAPVAAPASPQAPAEAPAAAKPRAVAPAPAAPQPPAPARRDDAPANKQEAAAAPAAAPATADAQRERRAEPASGALRREQGGALSKSAPADATTGGLADHAAEAAPAQTPPALQSGPAPTPPPTPAPAPAAPPAAPSVAAAPPARAAAPAAQAKVAASPFTPAAPTGSAAGGLSARDAASALPTADTLLLAGEGRSVQLPASQATRLVELVNRIGGNAQGNDPLREPVTLRIELRRQGQLVGVLEVAGPQVRWTAGRGAEARSATTQPGDTQLQALRDEFSRLTGR